VNATPGQRNAAVTRTAILLGIAYGVALALIAFWPTPVDQGGRASLLSILDWLHNHGVPEWLGYRWVEFAANIVLFMPVGLLGVVLIGARRWWLTFLSGFLLSCLIETGQLLFLPSRFPSRADILANTTGAVFGALLALLALAVLRVLSRPRVPVVAPGTIES